MFLPSPSETGSFEVTPAGTFTAICYRFIDRGTQISKFDGKLQHEVMLTWELCGELMEDGRPFSVSKTYRWSMHEKATLRHDLESWRGAAFTDKDFVGPNAFNTKNLLGKPCTLTIVHTIGKSNGQTYANVTSIGKLMKGVATSQQVNPNVYLALTKRDFDPTVFAALSDKMRAVIDSSPEYKDLMAISAPEPTGPKSDWQQLGKPSMAEIIDDDIPF